MARIGLSKPYVASYTYNSEGSNAGKVTLGTWTTIGKAVSVTLESGGTETDALYADNAVAESTSGFTSGSGTLTLDDLRNDARMLIYGLTAEEDGSIVQTVYGQPPYLALGFIVKHLVDNETKWTAVVLHKVKFAGDALEANTQGEDIDWQTPELDFSFYRDDTDLGAWQTSNVFDTESAAYAWISGITEFDGE